MLVFENSVLCDCDEDRPGPSEQVLGDNQRDKENPKEQTPKPLPNPNLRIKNHKNRTRKNRIADANGHNMPNLPRLKRQQTRLQYLDRLHLETERKNPDSRIAQIAAL